jgi:hypothetical protein
VVLRPRKSPPKATGNWFQSLAEEFKIMKINDFLFYTPEETRPPADHLCGRNLGFDPGTGAPARG